MFLKERVKALAQQQRAAAIAFLLCLPVFPAVYKSDRGAVVSRSTLASEVGRDILKQGGNAFDAAVATGFALAVTYPSAGNLGGGGFAVIRLSSGECRALDFRETAPKSVSAQTYLDKNGQVRDKLLTLHTLGSGVPGTVDGLLLLHKTYGTLPLRDLINPAIQLAGEGFVLPASLVESFGRQLTDMKRHPASMDVFTNGGTAYRNGDRWVQRDLMRTLKRIAGKGRAGFYEGKTAELIVREMKRTGGAITLEDLKAYRSIWREPVRGSYRGYQIISMPPPSSGGVLLVQMLNMLEDKQPGKLGWGHPDLVHWMIEAERLAFADRAVYLGDPDFNPLPVEQLIDKQYAKSRMNTVELMKAGDSSAIAEGKLPYESPETTHFSVMDRDGNIVAITTTLNLPYGNKIVVPGAGFLLNNEMDDFVVKAGVANSFGLLGSRLNLVEGGKRMLSSMAPTILLGPDESMAVYGAPGGSAIITTVLQVTVNLIDHKMTLDQAIRAPRFHHQWKPDQVLFEPFALNPALRENLTKRGHKKLVPCEVYISDVNGILYKNGLFEAVTDPRHDALPGAQ
ncbi:MAG: gamma-glutamyltransferase [Acidobacteria bacterium]|nr:MAG: gamma-glutamyltransferase [Acidobacteriota bacterium]